MSGGEGDWYDVIPIDDTHFLFVVGDVSGRGVEAATIMARLHFAIRAYAVQGDSPGEILGKLGRLLSIEHDRSFATVLCGLVDVTGHSIALVNAGHPPPLVLNGKSGHFIETSVFPPVGAQNSTPYEAVTVTVPEKATLVAFTDISGRGLQIVSALADEWGVIQRPTVPGKTVWATVALRPRRRDGAATSHDHRTEPGRHGGGSGHRAGSAGADATLLAVTSELRHGRSTPVFCRERDRAVSDTVRACRPS